MTDRINAQITFLREVDRLKSVDRANHLLDGTRPENAAEHSWHLALYALICAPLAADDVDVNRAITMLMLHDLVEIDTGDHPIHVATDWQQVAVAEAAAADRLFGILPPDQAQKFRQIWDEFEAISSATARFAKDLDRMQPVFQVLCATAAPAGHVDIVRENLATGRARSIGDRHQDIADTATALLQGTAVEPNAFSARLPFLSEADKLKQIYRASRLADNSRFENSGEHSWHIMVYALILEEYAVAEIQLDRVIRMLLIHDLVEIDAGDTPIHGKVDAVAQDMAEKAAAVRLFGLLPSDQGQDLHSLWLEFEAAESPDAVFAKAIDRLQVPVTNLINGGGTWVDYNVTFPQIQSRVGTPVNRGAPVLWDWISPQLELFLSDLS